ncbi:hypothetical protein QBC33DRAFT_529890, partial [Phialemonium atrogriseum]
MATTCRPSGPSLNYKSSHLPSSLLILFLSFVPLVFHRLFALGTPVSIDTLASIDSLPSVNSPVLRWHLVSVNILVLPQHSRPHRQSRLPALSPCQCFVFDRLACPPYTSTSPLTRSSSALVSSCQPLISSIAFPLLCSVKSPSAPPLVFCCPSDTNSRRPSRLGGSCQSQVGG